MPEQYQRKLIKFAARGISPTTPADVMAEGKYSRLLNVRGIKHLGTLETRPGLFRVNTTVMSGGVHSIRRLNDNIGADGTGVTPDYQYVIGAGTNLYYAQPFPSPNQNLVFTTLVVPSAGDPRTMSGRPLSLIPYRPEQSPRTWMYVGDADRMVKLGREDYSGILTARNWGIDPPRYPATSSGGAGAYYYRYTYRSSKTGAVSNPSPDMLTAQAVGTITATASTDLQVDIIDFYRFGGTLLEYFFVGSAPNTAPTFVDNVSDADAQLNEIIHIDNDQPFSIVSLPMAGGCTVVYAAGITTVTITSGDLMYTGITRGLAMKPGTVIQLGTGGTGLKNFVLYRPATSDTVFEVLGDATGSNLWKIPQPVLMAKPMGFVWGPWQGSLFAVGDFFNPGVLYWTNGNAPDTASSANAQEVTQPTEALMGGFTLDARNYVFSAERLFAIFPSQTGVGWEILETPCQRGLLYNWAYCSTGEKTGGGWVYFLAKDGIYRTQGGQAECITDADLFSLFPHEGTYGDLSPTTPVGGLYPPDLASNQRLYLRLEYSDGLLYFDYKDTQGSLRTLVYDERTGGWYADTYTPGLRMHYRGEGREIHELLSGAENGYMYRSYGTSDDGTAIPCNVRTHSEDMGQPGNKKLFGQIMLDLQFGDVGTVTPTLYTDNETGSTALTALTGAGRAQKILDIGSGQGFLGYNAALDLTWSSSGTPVTLYQWEPSAAPKPEDSQQRCIEWHEFIQGGNDAYVTGVVLWIDTRDLNNTPQTKTIQIWADQLYTGNSFNVSSNGEQKIELSWPVFKGKLARILPTDTNRCRVLKWEWQAQAEPLLISKWDTNWVPLGERTAVGYVTGIVVVADTLGAQKQLTFQSEFEGTVSTHTAHEAGGNSLTANGRITKSYSFTPFRAEQLRMYSYDEVIGRLYTWEWAIHYVEPRYFANWDATYQDWENERLIKGIRIFADTIGIDKTVQLEIDGVITQTFTMNHNGRETKHYDVALDGTTNEFPRGRSVRLYPIDAAPGFLYSVKYFADEEPGRLANWNAKWEDGGALGAKFVQGFVLDADTGGDDKTVHVEYYPEAAGSAMATSDAFTVNHTGRGGKAYSFAVPIVAHKFRLRPTDDAQRWLYGVKLVFVPLQDSVTHWETQAYAHGLASYQHRRDAYIAYESNAIVYWIIDIDGVQKTYVLPNTGGRYRKVYVPLLPIKGKLFKDTFTCTQPDLTLAPIVYTASLQNAAY